MTTMRYICALPNKKKAGRFPDLFTDDADAIAAFAAKWDVPGRAVYICPNPLLPDAKRRCLETVAAIVVIFADLDFKDIVEAPEEVGQRLRQLPLQPTWARASGGGYHVGYELKEPIERADDDYFRRAQEVQKRLVACLSADPAPSHAAALLRMEGTHNTKRGDPVLCETLWGSGDPVDLTDIEAMIDLLPEAGMFTRRPALKNNGHPKNAFEPSAGPLDVEACLASMEPNGDSVNDIQPRAILSLLQKAIHPDDVITTVVNATMAMAERNNLGWSRDDEIGYVTDRCRSSLGKLHGEYDPGTGAIPSWLAGEFHQAWIDALAAGKRPQLSRNAAGWYVRGLSTERNGSEGGGAKAGQARPRPGQPCSTFPRSCRSTWRSCRRARGCTAATISAAPSARRLRLAVPVRRA
jgi:hypothetical protein